MTEEAFAFDTTRSRGGTRILIGVDEVGRGSLAGPVVAAAVAFATGVDVLGVRDSKLLASPARDELAGRIRTFALVVAIAYVGPRVIETANIRRATHLAMRRALDRATRLLARRETGGLTLLALVDGNDPVPGLSFEQETVIGGDRMSACIAAASIVAKVSRDAFMTRLDAHHPAYGFSHHKGYGTPSHLVALREHGPCRWHRATYAPVAQLTLEGVLP